jgi:hypothetical protein
MMLLSRRPLWTHHQSSSSSLLPSSSSTLSSHRSPAARVVPQRDRARVVRIQTRPLCSSITTHTATTHAHACIALSLYRRSATSSRCSVIKCCAHQRSHQQQITITPHRAHLRQFEQLVARLACRKARQQHAIFVRCTCDHDTHTRTRTRTRASMSSQTRYAYTAARQCVCFALRASTRLLSTVSPSTHSV